MKKFYLVMIILLFIGAIISFIQGDYTMCVGTSATGLSCIALYEIECLKKGD